MKRSVTGPCAATIFLCLTLAACGKPEEQGSTSGEPSPSMTEQAADLQKKAEEKVLETAQKAEQAAAQAAETASKAAAEAAQQVGSATQAAGETIRDAGEAISDKALSQPEQIPGGEPGSNEPADAQ